MSNTKKIIFAVVLVVIGLAGRFLPHLWNFTPIIAISLFAGVYLGKRYAVAIPITSMFLSDVVIGFYSLPIMISVYGSFGLVGLLGYGLRKYKSFETVAALSIFGSVIFFLITNFAVWQWSPMYEPSLNGLIHSYTLALPFFRNALLGDIVYTFGLFGAYEVALYFQRRSFRKKFSSWQTKPSG